MPGVITGPGIVSDVGKLPPGIDQQKARFAVLVSQGTGLSLAAVLAWVRAEGGPTGNPLNIGPGRDYGTADAAAKATVDLLHTSLYKPIIATAQNAPRNVKAQLTAIAQSPWDAGHYTGGQHGPTPGVPWGTTLLGALHGVTPSTTTAAGGQGSVSHGDGILSGLTGWAGDLAGWAQAEAATALAYVVLTTLGLVLVTFGLLEVFGLSPREGAALAITRGRSTSRPKPGEPGSSQLAPGDSLPF